MGHIYQITNKVNGKIYIGFTSKFNYLDRWKSHLKHSRCDNSKNGSPVYNMSIIKAIKKYGESCFTVESLLEDMDDLWLLKVVEPFLIKIFVPEYNSTCGGEGVLGYKHTEKTKILCGMTMRGKKHSQTTRDKMKLAHKGYKPCLAAHEKAKEKFGHHVQIDNILFISKNDAARYLNIKYGLSRNTALRRISKGVKDFGENTV